MSKPPEPPDTGPNTRNREKRVSASFRTLRVRSAPLDGPSWQESIRRAGSSSHSWLSEPSAAPSMPHQGSGQQASEPDAEVCNMDSSLQGQDAPGSLPLCNAQHGLDHGIEARGASAGASMAETCLTAASGDLAMAEAARCADVGDRDDGSSTSSECSGSQHHAPSSLDRDAAIAAWLADHAQVTLADVEEAATPAKRFDHEPGSPSQGSEDSWPGLQPLHAAPAPAAQAFPYIVQPFDQAQAGAPHRAVQALNSRLQHGALDAHARQRAMRRDMRAATCDHQASHAPPPPLADLPHAAFPGPPSFAHPAHAADTMLEAMPAAVTDPAAATGRGRPTKMMRLGPLVQGAQQTIPTASGKGRIRIARMVF